MKMFNPINMIYCASECVQDPPRDRCMIFLMKANRVLFPTVAALSVAALCYLCYYPERHLSLAAKAVSISSELPGQVISTEVLPGMPVAQIRSLFEPVGAAEGIAAIDAVSKFKVVGIILDGNPQAVLQDRQDNRSVFVHQGDHVAGFLVKDIREGKVVLSTQNHEWELMP